MDRFYDYARENPLPKEQASYLDKIVKEYNVPLEKNETQPYSFMERCRRFLRRGFTNSFFPCDAFCDRC